MYVWFKVYLFNTLPTHTLLYLICDYYSYLAIVKMIKRYAISINLNKLSIAIKKVERPFRTFIMNSFWFYFIIEEVVRISLVFSYKSVPNMAKKLIIDNLLYNNNNLQSSSLWTYKQSQTIQSQIQLNGRFFFFSSFQRYSLSTIFSKGSIYLLPLTSL